MTRYFMRDTPLCQLEQQMMTPPNFKPRGHGRYSPGFQYSSEDTECPYCINFRRNQPCPLKLCICLDERIAAGALNLNEFVRDCFFPEAGVQLQARLERNFTCCSISFFLNESHRERWQHWHARCYRMSGRTAGPQSQSKALSGKFGISRRLNLSDAEIMRLTGLARNTYYKYKRELRGK